MTDQYLLGIDFGTLSARAALVRASDGATIAAATSSFRHAVMDRTLTAGDNRELPDQFALQNPGDYLEALREAVRAAVAQAEGSNNGDAEQFTAAQIVGIGLDFTACTMIPVDANGTPLCEQPDMRNRPHAYAKLWKHHAAQPQASALTKLAAGQGWLQRYGGFISSEWAVPKAWEVLQEDPEVYASMDRWIEAGDWIVWQLTGRYAKNTCAAGYKGMRQDGDYPPSEFFRQADPGLHNLITEKMAGPMAELSAQVGQLQPEIARELGLPAAIAVATAVIDAHVAAPAAGAVNPGQMLAIMGTSSCHLLSDRQLRDVPGICGVVDGGIIAGLYGYEAGQSGVGDIFGWFIENQVPPRYWQAAEEAGISLHEHLSELAARQSVGGHGLIALDWHLGNRSVLVDHRLSGVILGQTLQTRAEDIYRALIEATAFGTRKIVETYRAAGVEVTEFIAGGGLVKNRFLMQVYADVLQMPISIMDTDQPGALGSAIHAAVAAGIWPDIRAAAAAMGRRKIGVFQPRPEVAGDYDRLYREYLRVHDFFGVEHPEIMHRLTAGRRG